MLVELGLVEQLYQAVLEVLNDGAAVVDVARRYGVARQTVHEWLGRYAVTRKVDSSGNVCFAGTSYRVGSKYRRRQVQVAVVGDTVEISVGEELIRSHAVRHDRTREHGALANPGGRPHRINAA